MEDKKKVCVKLGFEIAKIAMKAAMLVAAFRLVHEVHKVHKGIEAYKKA